MTGPSLVTQVVENLPAMWETQVGRCVGKIPWRKKWQPSPVFLPGESHGQRSLAGYSPWSRRQLDTPEQLTPPVTKSRQLDPSIIFMGIYITNYVDCLIFFFFNCVQVLFAS